MAKDPDVLRIWRWHAPDLTELKHRLVAFLSGFVGGPPLCPQLYGPPFMRARHLKFRIGAEERGMGLKYAFAALNATVADREARAEFGSELAAFADYMRKRDCDGEREATGAAPPRPAI